MVHVENITFSYPRQTRNILEKISFHVNPGECLAILGNNGAGKSTLLKCINRICRAHSGSVRINEKNVFQMNHRSLAQHIAYVPQRTEHINMTVFDTVLLGRKPYIQWDVSSKDREIVAEILEQMNMEGFALRLVSELSGGEVQKVMLARALAQDPELLLLDEPISNLDPYNQQEVLHIISKIAKEHQISVIMILHDLNLATRYCDRFLFLKNAQVYACGSKEIITTETIQNVYGIHVDIFDYKNTKIILPV